MKNDEDKKRFKFTKPKLLKLTPPVKPDGKTGGVYETYSDTEDRGFKLLVSNGGAKTFYLYKKINKIPKRIKIGSFPDMSLERAREKVQLYKGLIAQGKDPHEENQRIKTEGNLKTFFLQQYIPRHAQPHNKTWQHDIRAFELYLTSLQNKTLSEVTRSNIDAMHKKVRYENGLYVANRALALVHSIYNKAIDWGWQGLNPAKGVKKFTEKSRKRFLNPEEIPAFFEALDEEPNVTMRDYFYVLLLTGVRRRNVGSMKWKDISLELETWTLEDTKNGESQLVYLPPLIIDILKKRMHDTESVWVFPSKTSASGHIEEPKSAWKRILQRANLDDLRIHDLRRTLASYQAINGSNSFTIGKSLGQKSAVATAIYAQLDRRSVRVSVDRAIEDIFTHKAG